jgi:hypothetical protein
MKTRAPALRRAAQKPLPQAPAPAAKPAPRRAATMRKKTKAEACRMKAADRRRCVPGALSGRAARNFLQFTLSPSGTFASRFGAQSDPSRSRWILFFSFFDATRRDARQGDPRPLEDADAPLPDRPPPRVVQG